MFTETRKALSKLEHGAREIARAAGTPALYGAVGRQWYRFSDETVLQVATVKAVRVVSGLYATFRLLELGYAVEAAVLLRTVDDFIDEITFLIEGHESGAARKAHQAFLKHFFEESIDTPEERLEDRRRPDRVKKKNIQASQARYLNPENPDSSRRLVKAVDQALDGYVHGAYPHSMELYDPNFGGGQFRMTGIDGTPYPDSCRKHLAFYVSRALNVFGMVLLLTGRQSTSEELIAARNRFEASDEYPGASSRR